MFSDKACIEIIWFRLLNFELLRSWTLRTGKLYVGLQRLIFLCVKLSLTMNFRNSKSFCIFSNSLCEILSSRHYGIPDNHRILDARKGPVKKTAAVKTLPKIQNLVTPGSADSGLEKSSKLHKLNHYKKIMDENSRIGASTH